MSTNESESWTRITVPKVRSLGMSRLASGKGPVTADHDPDGPLTGQAGPKAAHAMCVDHVKVEGFRRPVCILKGQNRDQIIAEARSLGSTLILTRLGGVS